MNCKSEDTYIPKSLFGQVNLFVKRFNFDPTLLISKIYHFQNIMLNILLTYLYIQLNLFLLSQTNTKIVILDTCLDFVLEIQISVKCTVFWSKYDLK